MNRPSPNYDFAENGPGSRRNNMLEPIAKSEWVSESWRVSDMRVSWIVSSNTVLCESFQNVAGWRRAPRRLLNRFKINSQRDQASGTCFCWPTSVDPWLHPLSLLVKKKAAPVRKKVPQQARESYHCYPSHHTHPPFFSVGTPSSTMLSSWLPRYRSHKKIRLTFG